MKIFNFFFEISNFLFVYFLFHFQVFYSFKNRNLIQIIIRFLFFLEIFWTRKRNWPRWQNNSYFPKSLKSIFITKKSKKKLRKKPIKLVHNNNFFLFYTTVRMGSRGSHSHKNRLFVFRNFFSFVVWKKITWSSYGCLCQTGKLYLIFFFEKMWPEAFLMLKTSLCVNFCKKQCL